MTDVPEEYYRDDCGVCVVDGKIILIGGRGEGRMLEDTLDSVIEWDPITDKWRHLNKLKSPRAGPKICVTGGKIFVAGGWKSGERSDESLSEEKYCTIACYNMS